MIKKVNFPLLLVIILLAAASCKHDLPVPVIPPPPGTDTTDSVCFQASVLPIFQTNCAKSGCHDAATREEGFQLDNYSGIMKGVNPGNASSSKVYEVLFKTGEKKMPPAGNTPLTDAQKYLIQTWINQGAVNNTSCTSSCDSSTITYSGGVKPILETYCYGCHAGAASSGGGIPLDTYDGVKSTVDFNMLYPAVTHTGPSPMPQGAAKLSDCKIAVIRKWIEAGATNN